MTHRIFACHTEQPPLLDRAARDQPPRGLLAALLAVGLLVPLAGAADPPAGWLSALVGGASVLVVYRLARGRAAWGWLLIVVGLVGLVVPRTIAQVGPALFTAWGVLLVLWLANRHERPARNGRYPSDAAREREAQRQAGAAGELQVREVLARELPEDYVVIHGLKLPRAAGDIDHLVVGPTGVFLLETKTMAGYIVCDPDGTWRRTRVGRAGTPYSAYIGDPAAQVRRNIHAVRECIGRQAPRLFARPSLWIEGVVVFPHPATELDAEHSRVPAIHLDEAAERICGHRPRRTLSNSDVVDVVSALLLDSQAAGQRIAVPAQAMVETALALPVILSLLFGLVALSRVVQAHAGVVAVAHEVARAGALGATPDDALRRMAVRVDQVAPGLGLNPAALEVDSDVSDFARRNGRVRATVRYRVDLAELPMVGWAVTPSVQAGHVEWIDPYRAGLAVPAEAP